MDEARISSGALAFLLAASKNVYPREFTAQLRVEDGVITEVLVTPKATYGEGFATTRFDMMPLDRSIQGSFHSHPSENISPSDADRVYFRKTGVVHLIAKHPFSGVEDVAAYNVNAERIPIRVLEDE